MPTTSANSAPASAPATPTELPGRWRRLARWAPWPVLALGLGWQAWLGLRWIRLDQSVCEGVFPYGVWPLAQMLDRIELGQMPEYLRTTLPPDLFSFTALAGRAAFGADPDSLLITMLLLLLLTQLLLFDLGRLLASPWAGVLAALLLPLAPDSGALARRWAAQLPHMLLLVACASCVVRSRSFTRWLPSLGFVLLTMLGMAYSVWLTDDLLFLGAAGSLALGAGMRGMVLGEGPLSGVPLDRRRVLVGGLITAALLALGGWVLIVHRLELSYYVSETSADQYRQAIPPWRPQALTAYLRLLWRDNQGPWLSLAGVVGTALYIRRGKARTELLAWLLIPLLALSLIAKKNSYYLAVIYPVLPLVTALGLASLRRRWLSLGSMAVVLAGAWWSWQQASFTPTLGAPPRLGDYDAAFQSVNPPVLGYRQDAPFARELRLVTSQRGAILAVDDALLCIMPQHEIAELELALEPLLPGTRTRNHPVMAPCDWLLIRLTTPPGAPMPEQLHSAAELPHAVQDMLQRRPFALVNQDTSHSPVLYLLRQDREQ